MDGFVMPKITVYIGEIGPRTVQKIRRSGYLCAVFPARENAPELCVLEDIDGSKLIACFAEQIDEQSVAQYFAPVINRLTDLPLRKIEGAPDDSALTYAENGTLPGLAPMTVNAANIGLKEMVKEPGGIRIELWETAGKETDLALYCAAYDFGFRALFQPYEIKRFYVDADGCVTEKDFD